MYVFDEQLYSRNIQEYSHLVLSCSIDKFPFWDVLGVVHNVMMGVKNDSYPRKIAHLLINFPIHILKEATKNTQVSKTCLSS